MANLPNELIEEVLISLPPKSLMRFKSVSHAWNKTICSSTFVRSYGELKKKDSNKVLIYKSSYDNENPLAYSFSSNRGTVAEEVVPHNFGKCRIVGSCDGLLLVYDSRYGNKLCMWNPYTRECRDVVIPDDIDDSFGRNFSFYKCGFGCASSLDNENHNNYKVLLIRNISYNVVKRKSLSKVALYTSRTNSIKRLKNIPYEADYDHFTLVNHFIPVNTKLHIFAHKLTMKTILAFDVGDEEVKEVPGPDYDVDCSWYSMAELKGNLCLVSYKNGTPLEQCMWVMKEYGVRESWTKISRLNFHNRRFAHTYIKPLHLYDNNQILLQADSYDDNHYYSNLLFINHVSENMKSKIFKLDGVPNRYRTIAYEETLLSPNAI